MFEKQNQHEQGQPDSGGLSNQLENIYRSLLRIVAGFENQEYSEDELRQTNEWGLDDLADPASANDTTQG